MHHRHAAMTEDHRESSQWDKDGLTADAPIWRVYHEHAQKYDERMLRDWNCSIDTMLIFAGMFSATTTAFIIEAYKQMVPDYTQLLFLALTAGGNSSTAAPPGPFVVPTSAYIVNRLWIGSLIVSLFAALVAILAKQWLTSYRMDDGGDLREWAQLHQFRYECFGRWRVPEIVACLPLLLHISLLLFLTGLVVFLSPIDYGTMLLAVIVCVVGCNLYIGSLLCPIVWPSSPYRTQLTPIVLNGVSSFRRGWERVGTIFQQGRATSSFVPRETTTWLIFRDPWYFVGSASNQTQCLIPPLAWLGGITTSQQVLGELVDALGDMNVGREVLSALPTSVQFKLAGSVAHRVSKEAPVTVRDRRTGILTLHPTEFRACNVAASVAVPGNVEARVRDMCVALCSRLGNLTPCDARKLAPHPAIEALSNAMLWLSIHSDVDPPFVRATNLVASPAKFGLDASVGTALLRRIEVRPLPGLCRDSGGVTRMLNILFIWRELFITDDAVHIAVACLWRGFASQTAREPSAISLSLWHCPDPRARLAHVLASVIQAGVQCYCFTDRTRQDAAVQHLLWLLAGSPEAEKADLDIDLSQLWPDGRTVCPDAIETVKRIVGSPAFLRPAYAYPALVVLGAIGRRCGTTRSSLALALAQHCAKYVEPVLANALSGYNGEQLSALLDCVIDFRMIFNLVAVMQNPSDRVRAFLILSSCVVLRPECHRRHGYWFTGRVLFHAGYKSLSPARPVVGSLPWIHRSLVSDTIYHLLAETRIPGRSVENRGFSPVGSFLRSLLSFTQHARATRDEVLRLAADIRKAFDEFDNSSLDASQQLLAAHECPELDLDGEAEARAVYRLV